MSSAFRARRPVAPGAVLALTSMMVLAACGDSAIRILTPSMGATSFATLEDTALRGTLQPQDADGAALRFATASAPAHGALVLEPSGAFVYTPAADYAGDDHFSVTVTRGDATFPAVEVTVTVSAVNDAPVLKATRPALTTPEDTALALQVSDLVERDVDDALGALTLAVKPGADFTFANGRITPAQDFHGTLELEVEVSDGKATVPLRLPLEVTPVNDAPVVSAQAAALAGTEDTAFSLSLQDVVVTDVDSAPAQLALRVLDGTGYTHAGNTVTPAQDLNGALSVQVAVGDGTAEAAPFSLSITLAPVNDAPVLSAQAHPLTTAEDTGLALGLADVTVSDVDSPAASLTLSVGSGPGYSVQGTTVVPDADLSGTLSVPVTVSDGALASASRVLSVTVTPVNDAPRIGGQARALTTSEDTALTLALSDLTVTDVDSAAGALSLVVLDGAGYTHAGSTITPAQDASGALSVQVAVDDGSARSTAFGLQVSVTPVNDAPRIAGQKRTLQADEDTAFTPALADLDVVDVDSPASSFALVVLDGAGYTHVGNSVTPAQDASGPLTVQVAVSDGSVQSAPFALAATIAPVNDAPVITAQARSLSTDEDTAFSVALADVTVTDVDNAQGELSLAVQDGPGYTHVGNTVTPDADLNGTLSVLVRVGDGVAQSAPFTLAVTVGPLNDAPVITAQARSLSTDEDTAFAIALADVTASDAEGTPLTLAVQDGTGYTHVGNTVMPAQDFHGALQVAVRVSDGSAQSAPFSLDVTVAPVNDAPVIRAQARALSTSEDTAFTPVLSDLTVADVDSSSFTLLVQDGTGYTHAGNTVTPASNFSGTLTVQVVVSDGALQSAAFPLAVTVGEVNDAPVVTAQARAVSTPEDTAFTPALADLAVVDSDNLPSELSVVVQDGVGYSHVGNAVTPAQDFNGTLQVGVRVSDGSAQSAPFMLAVTVTPVNDAPVIAAQVGTRATNEDTAFSVSLADVSASDVEGSALTLAVLDDAAYTHAGNTVTPLADMNGALQVKVAVSDGSAQSAPFLLDVTVAPVNDAPVVRAQARALATNEDTALTLSLADVTVTDVDSPDTSFALVVLPGARYSVSGLQITPEPNYYGPLSVNVAVGDGSAQSAPFALDVTVISVNSKPAISAQAHPLSVNEDTALTLVVGDVVASDPDTGTVLTLVVLDDAAYSRVGNSITPPRDFHGALKVGVAVSDGEVLSDPFLLDVTVNPVNDAPVIASQKNARFTAEETPVTLVLDDVNVSDVDLPLQPLTLAVQDGTGYTHAGNTVTPARDVTGTVKVNVTVSDGSLSSQPFAMDLDVTPVNDAPVVVSQVGTLSVPEEGAFEVLLSAVTVTDVDSDPSTFVLEVQDSAAYSHVGNTVTPPVNFNGPLTVSVRVSDGQASSAAFPLTLTVTPVNDAPVIAGQVALTIKEDEALPLTLAHFTVQDPDSGSFTLSVGGGTGPGPAGDNYTRSGNTLTPVSNFWGTLSVPVTVSDGSLSSAVFTVTVTVQKVNKLPVVANETYSTSANTRLAIAAAAGVLINDTDRESSLVVSSTAQVATAQGGTVTVAADGSFVYRPKAGFSGADTFNYTVKESDNTQTVVGTATVNVVGPVIWYVNNTAATAGDGRSDSPFKDLSSAQTPSAAGSIIFVYRGTGAAYGGIVLDANQQLLGEATGLTSGPNVSIAPNGNVPLIGNTVTLADGATVANVTLSSANDGLVGTGLATVTLTNVPVTAARDGVRLTGTGNASSTSSTATLNNVSVTSTNGRALTASNFGTLTIPANTVRLIATNGAALDLASINTVSLKLEQLSSTNSTAQGVRLSGITAGTITVQQPVAITSAQGSTVTDMAGAAEGMILQNFSASLTLPQLNITGGRKGLVLENFTGTFALGPATGVAGTSGTIQRTSRAGVVLTNATNVTLRGLKVSLSLEDGLRVTDGTQVSGLTIADSEFSQTGSGPLYSALHFGHGGSTTRTAQLAGTAAVRNTVLKNLDGGGLYLESGRNALSLTLDGLTVDGVRGGSGIVVRADGTGSAAGAGDRPQLTLLVDNTHVTNVSAGGNGLDLATEGGPAALTATVEDSIFDNASADGGNAVRVSADGTDTALTATVRRNTLRNWFGHALLLQNGDQRADLRATVDGNTIIGDTVGAGINAQGSGIRVLFDPDVGTTAMSGRVVLNNNNISKTGLHGIEALVRQSGTPYATNRLDLSVLNNTVDTTRGHALLLQATDTSSALCAVVTNNRLTAGSPYLGARLSQLLSATFWVQGPTAADTTTIRTHLQAANPVLTPVASVSGTYTMPPSACLVP